MSFNEEHAIETYKSLISISTETLKALQLLNGGAVITLLAYLGKRPELATLAKPALGLFVIGLVAASIGFITSYLTQLAIYNESVYSDKYTGLRHGIWLWITFGIAVISVALFALGAFAGVNAVAHQTRP
jgi:hypothetical protein